MQGFQDDNRSIAGESSGGAPLVELGGLGIDKNDTWIQAYKRKKMMVDFSNSVNKINKLVE